MSKKQTKAKGATKVSKATKAAAAPAPKVAKPRERDPRLPAAGTVLTRSYKGKELRVTVLDDGFRFDGAEYRSLSAVAQKATGYAAINGVAWWGLAGPWAATPKPAAAKGPRAKRSPTAPKEDAPAAPAPTAETATA